ncbi:MAG: hypothetical protein RR854_00425 [Muribaculaceae bacterium]
MELNEFISNTIADIHKGIEVAKDKIGKDVIPQNISSSSNLPTSTKRSGDNKISLPISVLDFEVILSENTSDKVGGKLSVIFGYINGISSGNHGKEISDVTKVKFSIPIVL